MKLRLSLAGQSALSGFYSKHVIDVKVEWADELGLWIYLAPAELTAVTVVLIRWEHFETAIMDVDLEQPKPRPPLGFALVSGQRK